MTSTAIDLISSGVLQQQLLPRLSLADLCSLESVSPAFRQLLSSEDSWRRALARTLPPSHPFTHVQTQCREAGQQYAASQRAIAAADFVTATAEAGSSFVTGVTYSGIDLAAVFSSQKKARGFAGRLRGVKRRISLFHLSSQELLQQLHLEPAPGLHLGQGDDLEHEWSPDCKQLAVTWQNGDTLGLACLSQVAATEWEVDFYTATGPVCWAPCSSLIMLVICPQGSLASRLAVLNPELEAVYSWPTAQDGSLQLLPPSCSIIAAWTPSSTLMAAVCTYVDAAPTPPLEVIWHGSLQEASSSQEADLARVLLAGLTPEQRLKRLIWAPLAGAAALTQVLGGKGSDCLYTLYVQLPGSLLASIASDCSQDGMVRAPTVMWSPTGEHVLVDAYLCLELFTSTCTRVLRAEGDVGSKAVFSPDGLHMAAVCRTGSESGSGKEGKLALNLYRTHDGALLFSQPRKGELTGRLAFSAWGDQLIFTGRKMLAISFGQAHRPNSLHSRQMCDALASVGSRAGAEFKDLEDSASMPSLSGMF